MHPGQRDHRTSRRRARLGDAACIGVALVIGGLASDASGVETTRFADANTVVGLLATVALWWRRRSPVVVAGVTFLAAAAAPLAAGAAVISVFTVAAHRPTRTALIATGVYLLPHVIGIALFAGRDLDVVVSASMGALLTLAALGWGFAVRSRREVMVALADRAERAETEQQLRVEEARRAERSRIASEMHDVLAHRLSMLSLHAGAIEVRPTGSPEELTEAAQVIRTNAHLALEELREVIGVLRDDTGGSGLAPLPTANDVAGLIDESRAAGMQVEGDVTIDLVALPQDLGRHVFRIVQEGLTNARKHAPGQRVRLAISGQPGGEVVVAIVNDAHQRLGSPVPDPGFGLIGLRERVTSVGGELHVGRAGAGTHRLCARLPWPAR